ncbi:DRAP deaminase [Allomyces javanicus]|nr:DRAP deaminase [Allomyces javanicus]
MSTTTTTTSTNADPADLYWLRHAITIAHRSAPVPSAYCVGAVLVSRTSASTLTRAPDAVTPPDAPTNHIVLATGYSRELPGNTHAEEVCLLKLPSGMDLAGCTLYTTMEPCSTRLSGRPSCTGRVLDAKVPRVVMGIVEPADLFVQCTGADTLRERGVEVVHVQGLEEECWAPNRHLRERYDDGRLAKADSAPQNPEQQELLPTRERR